MNKSARITAARLAWVVGLLLLGLVAPTTAQFPPDSFTNLQVLPQNIEWPTLQRLMRSFNSALGTNGCLYCHVGERGQPQSTWNFPADEKPTKRRAREMIRMVQAINGEHLANLPDQVGQPMNVTCDTCHRGIAVPQPLSTDLLNAYSQTGTDGLIDRYHYLRLRHYERDAYDFSWITLASVASQLRARGELDDAVTVLELNVDVHPHETPAITRLLEYDLERKVLETGADAGRARYLDLRVTQVYPFRAFSSQLLNTVGYRLLRAGRVEDAIGIFALNVENYPNDWNVYDSLGEAYMTNGDTELAIENYERSVELNPQNRNGTEVLERVKGRRDELE